MKNTASLARAIIMFLPWLWHPRWNCCCFFQDLSWNGEECLISFGRTPSSRQCSNEFYQVIFPFKYSLIFVPRSLRWAFQEPEDCSSCEQSKYRLRLLCFHLSAWILWHFRHSMVLGHFSRLSQNTAGNDRIPLSNDGILWICYKRSADPPINYSESCFLTLVELIHTSKIRRNWLRQHFLASTHITTTEPQPTRKCMSASTVNVPWARNILTVLSTYHTPPFSKSLPLNTKTKLNFYCVSLES